MARHKLMSGCMSGSIRRREEFTLLSMRPYKTKKVKRNKWLLSFLMINFFLKIRIQHCILSSELFQAV